MNNSAKIAYVVKRYPRYSETFIVNEILAHEAAGQELEIIAVRPCTDTHYQDRIARVKAPVTLLPAGSVRGDAFWSQAHRVACSYPEVWNELGACGDEDVLDAFQALLLCEIIRTRNIVHLHAHFATSSTSVARIAARITGISYTFTAHAKDIYHESVQPADLRRKLRDAASVVTVSDFNRLYLQETYGADARTVQRVHNGIDLEAFQFSLPNSRSRSIIAVGRLVEKKGFGVLIDACACLRDAHVDFQCQIVGQGEDEKTLHDQIARHHLQDRVLLLGPRPQAEVIRLIRDAAVLAAPCIVGTDGNRDGMPTVLLESMALGTPCVATDVTGIPEAMTHNEHGLIVPQHDAVYLARTLQSVLDDPHLRTRLAIAARQRVERDFSVTRACRHLRQIFQSAIARSHPDTTTFHIPRDSDLLEIS